MTEIRKVAPLDWVTEPACTTCGSTAWVVDGDGQGKFWLLCADVNHKDCVETRGLPGDLVIIDNRQ